MAVFRDFIPEGEPLDGLGNGFTDFVPEATPVFVDSFIHDEKPTEEEAPKKTKKGKE